MHITDFRQIYPTDTLVLPGGKSFPYRYYKNPQAKATIALLTGGLGLSDLFYPHFDRLTKEFSVLTFDYPICFADNKELAHAVAELLHHLGEKVWLVGQSLGGVVAQIIAARHPEVVAGSGSFQHLLSFRRHESFCPCSSDEHDQKPEEIQNLPRQIGWK